MSDIKIWAPKPFTSGAVNIKFTNGNKELSLALDDSAGVLDECRRGSIACFQGDKSVTEEVYGQKYEVYLDMESFEEGLAWLKR